MHKHLEDQKTEVVVVFWHINFHQMIGTSNH